MKDVGGADFAESSPSFLGRERAAVNVDVGPERRSPRYQIKFCPSCKFSRVFCPFGFWRAGRGREKVNRTRKGEGEDNRPQTITVARRAWAFAAVSCSC